MTDLTEATIPITDVAEFKQPYGAHIRPTRLTIRYSQSEFVGYAGITIDGEQLGRHGHPYAAMDWFARTEWPDWARALVVANLPNGYTLPDLDVFCGGRDCADC